MPAQDTYGKFYQHPQLDGQHFNATGEKKFNDVVMVEVFIKGNTKNSISKPVFDSKGEPVITDTGESFLELYPRAWAHYNHEAGIDVDGTPLRLMGGIGAGQIMNLNAQGIETVEDLANLLDNVVVGEPGMTDLRKKAQAYLAALDPEKAEAERKAAAEEIDALKRQVSKLQSEMQKALDNQTIPHKEPPKKRGRPKKEEA